MDSFDPVISAHKHSSNHREEILSSNIVGCFYCLNIYKPTEIHEWIDSDDSCALCPKCGIDSVIGSNSGYPINDEFLRRMRSHWF
ncbi:MAG: cytoplasmic protein [Acidobacteria bacterium]|nr:MAG: cytoplasmic protein [Acidobacteriota bacterium]